MDSKYKHCSTKQCFDSATMMCDHESYLATQYYLDQTKMFMSRFQPQHIRGCFAGMDDSALVFDKGIMTQQYNKDVCDPKISVGRGGNAGAADAFLGRNELYLEPCSRPTNMNNIECTAEACCSKTHQLFGNTTRAGTGVLPTSARAGV